MGISEAMFVQVGLSSLWTLFFPSVAKHQQTQRYKNRSINRKVFEKKALALRQFYVAENDKYKSLKMLEATEG